MGIRIQGWQSSRKIKNKSQQLQPRYSVQKFNLIIHSSVVSQLVRVIDASVRDHVGGLSLRAIWERSINDSTQQRCSYQENPGFWPLARRLGLCGAELGSWRHGQEHVHQQACGHQLQQRGHLHQGHSGLGLSVTKVNNMAREGKYGKVKKQPSEHRY